MSPQVSEIVSRLQEQVPGHRIKYAEDSIWVGGWEALKEVTRALEEFRYHGEDPIRMAIGLLLDAVQERDPTASRPPAPRKNQPKK